MLVRILFFILIALPFGAIAKGKLDKLPEVEKLDINTFVSKAQKIEKTFEDKSLNFSIEIPKNFVEKENSDLKNSFDGNRLNGEIFYAYGAPIQDMRPYVSVQSIKLDRLISAKNWFVSEVLKLGYTLRAIESIDGDDQFDAFYIRLDDFGRTEIVRGRGFRNENRLVLVEYVIPTLLWQSDRDVQIFSIKSFEFKNKYDVVSPEEMVKYAYLDGFYTEFPKGWLMKARTSDAVNQLDLNLKAIDRDRFIFSEVDATVVSSRSLRDNLDKRVYEANLPNIIKERQSSIKNNGLAFDDVLERHNLEVGFETDMNVTEVYQLRRAQSDDYVSYEKNPVVKEFWLTIIRPKEKNGKNYVISMTAPPRDVDMYKWALALDTYKNMIKTMR